MNGNHVHTQDHRPAPVPTATAKKGKQKKALDSNEASKLVAARISQLEVDNAAEKEENIEIGELNSETPISQRVARDISHVALEQGVDWRTKGRHCISQFDMPYTLVNRFID